LGGARSIDQGAHGRAELRTDFEPVINAVELDQRSAFIGTRIMEADLLDKAAITGHAFVGDNDAVEGALFGATTGKTNNDHVGLSWAFALDQSLKRGSVAAGTSRNEQAFTRVVNTARRDRGRSRRKSTVRERDRAIWKTAIWKTVTSLALASPVLFSHFVFESGGSGCFACRGSPQGGARDAVDLFQARIRPLRPYKQSANADPVAKRGFVQRGALAV